MTDENLGDPRVPQPGDPTEMQLHLTGQDVQLLFGALGEVPAKFSRPLLDKIERQRDEQVLAARCVRLEQKKSEDAERLKAAEERRAKKDAKRAATVPKAKNGAAAAPAS